MNHDNVDLAFGSQQNHLQNCSLCTAGDISAVSLELKGSKTFRDLLTQSNFSWF